MIGLNLNREASPQPFPKGRENGSAKLKILERNK
jgi:hypothetical protein